MRVNPENVFVSSLQTLSLQTKTEKHVHSPIRGANTRFAPPPSQGSSDLGFVGPQKHIQRANLAHRHYAYIHMKDTTYVTSPIRGANTRFYPPPPAGAAVI
jgi:hypothetical protein